MDHRRIAVLLAGAAAFINLYAPQSILPDLRAWMGSSTTLAGMVISATTAGVALAAPFVGWLGDHLGRRRVIVTAAWIAILPTLLVSIAQTPTELIVARFIEGLTLPGVFTVTVAYIGDEWAAHEARSVTALYVAGTIAGGFSGRLVTGVVAEFAGWRGGIAAVAVLQVIFALLIQQWLLATHRPALARPRQPFNPLRFFAHPVLRSAYLCGPVILFALVGGFTYVTLLLAAPPYHLSPAGLSAIFAVYLVGMVVTPWSGRLLNALGPANTILTVWALSIAGLLITLLHGLIPIIIGLCLFSIGLFFAQTTITNVVGETVPETRGAALGLYSSCYYIGGSFGGVVPAIAWSHAGWPGVVVLISSAGGLSALTIYRLLRRSPRKTVRP